MKDKKTEIKTEKETDKPKTESKQEGRLFYVPSEGTTKLITEKK